MEKLHFFLFYIFIDSVMVNVTGNQVNLPKCMYIQKRGWGVFKGCMSVVIFLSMAKISILSYFELTCDN